MLRLIALVMIAALLSMTMISVINTKHFAEAKKASGDDVSRTLRHKYSNWVGNKVCGEELCPGHSYFKWNMKYRSYQSPYNTYENAALSKTHKQK